MGLGPVGGWVVGEEGGASEVALFEGGEGALAGFLGVGWGVKGLVGERRVGMWVCG